MRFLISIIVLTALFACKKKQNTDSHAGMCADQPPVYLNSEITDSKFKMGTYWVYIDSVTSQIDTMKITSIISEGLQGNSKCSNQKHEYYAFEVNKKYSGTTTALYDIFSLQYSDIMLNQTQELGNNFIYRSNSTKIDSLFIYDRYYRSVVKSVLGNVTLYYNTGYGLLKIENPAGKKLLKDKFIVR
ncbi:MAG: hypothetical protein V4677_17470 [Bacteroidota bacterium]